MRPNYAVGELPNTMGDRMSVRYRLIGFGAACAATAALTGSAASVASAICSQPCKPPPTMPPVTISGSQAGVTLTGGFFGSDQWRDMRYPLNVPPATFTANANGSPYPVRVVAQDTASCSSGSGTTNLTYSHSSAFTTGSVSVTFQPATCPAGSFLWSSTQSAQAQQDIGGSTYTTHTVGFSWWYAQ
jgi:hypothetical protein